MDVYKTLSPLKATPHVLALASLDLAMRLEDQRVEIKYEQFEASREVVLCEFPSPRHAWGLNKKQRANIIKQP